MIRSSVVLSAIFTLVLSSAASASVRCTTYGTTTRCTDTSTGTTTRCTTYGNVTRCN